MAATLGVSGVAGSMPAEAADVANAQVTVGATVLRHLGIRVLTAPHTIRIVAADIVRGYVDMPLASTLEIRSNNLSGYMLVIDSQADFSIGTEVRSLGGVSSLGRTGGVLSFQASGSGMQTTPVALSFRVLLSGAARPGNYPWPIQISVLPV